MFVNSQVFREPAIHFAKTGRYADGDPYTPEWDTYWEQEHDKVENGYEVGGCRITGKHYLYLNYLPIQRTNKVEEKVTGLFKDNNKHSKKVGVRKSSFPDFWDEDYAIFHIWDICYNGISLEEFDKVNKYCHIPIVKTPYNLSGGHHFLWLKPRGVGASWKAATVPIFRQFFQKDTKTFITADMEQYLLKDGIYEKYLHYRNAINAYSPDNNSGRFKSGFERQFSLMGTKEMEYRSSYWATNDSGNKIEKGKKSSVYGVVVDGNPNKLRGKRGTIIYEEFGSFPNVDKAWGVAQSSVEEDGVVYDTMYGFGTGGDNGADIEPISKMFYDPRSYNLLEFENEWDEQFYGQSSAYFTPAYKTIGFKDKEGNSLQDEAKSHYLNIRNELKYAKDPTVLPAHKAEKPFNPQEALLDAGENIFPVDDLIVHLNHVEVNKIDRSLVSTGRIVDGGLDKNGYPKVKFRVNSDLIPYIEFPVMKKSDKKGALCVVHLPFMNNGEIPENLYRITVDPYRHDTSTGNSVGAIYVVENPNSLTYYKGDKIVAWYVGRPDTQDEFNKVLFDLAKLYNCKIAPENDEPGGIIDYAKRFKLKMYLEPEFELAYDISIKTKNPTAGKVGMHIASGENNLRKKQGDKLIQEWLLRVRGVDKNGKLILNLHTIYDVGLLKELIKYKEKGNFDRVSALRINMFYEKEFAYQNRFVKFKNKQKSKFFQKELFK